MAPKSGIHMTEALSLAHPVSDLNGGREGPVRVTVPQFPPLCLCRDTTG